MQYIVRPIAQLIDWTFDTILVPIGELPAIINPNNIFIVLMVIGLFVWLFFQRKYDKKAEREGGLK
jgi:hypothetical protein